MSELLPGGCSAAVFLLAADNVPPYRVSTGWLCFQLSPFLLSDPFIQSIPHSLIHTLAHASLPGVQLCSSIFFFKEMTFNGGFPPRFTTSWFGIVSCGPAASWRRLSKPLAHYSQGCKAGVHFLNWFEIQSSTYFTFTSTYTEHTGFEYISWTRRNKPWTHTGNIRTSKTGHRSASTGTSAETSEDIHSQRQRSDEGIY